MGLFLIGSLPPQLFRRMADGIGVIWFAVDKRHRRVAEDNISIAFGEELSPGQITKLAKESFKQLARSLFEVGWSLRLNRYDIKKYVDVEGFDHLNRAFSRKKGALLLTGHIGSWELLTLVPALLNPAYIFHDIYRPLDYKPLEDVVTRFRTRCGMKLIPKDHSMIKIFRALKRGEGVGIPLDQSVVDPRNRVFVDFFGILTSTNKGLAQIALRTSAPVVPVFMVRDNNKYKVIFSSAISMHKTGDEEKDIRLNTERFNKVIETFIKKYPTQWFWVHGRWKRIIQSDGNEA